MIYASDYCVKPAIKTQNLATLYGLGVQRVEQLERNRGAPLKAVERSHQMLVRCLNQLGGAQERSGQEVAQQLLGLPNAYKSHDFTYVMFNQFLHWVDATMAPPAPADGKSDGKSAAQSDSQPSADSVEADAADTLIVDDNSDYFVDGVSPAESAEDFLSNLAYEESLMQDSDDEGSSSNATEAKMDEADEDGVVDAEPAKPRAHKAREPDGGDSILLKRARDGKTDFFCQREDYCHRPVQLEQLSLFQFIANWKKRKCGIDERPKTALFFLPSHRHAETHILTRRVKPRVPVFQGPRIPNPAVKPERSAHLKLVQFKPFRRGSDQKR